MVKTQVDACYHATQNPLPSLDMERVLDFSDVTSYDFSLMGADMVLKLFQGNVVTKIRIGTGKMDQDPKPVQQRRPIMATLAAGAASSAKPAVVGLIRKNEQAAPLPTKPRKASLTRLTASQVKEIRENWDATVKACGTKNAAADQLGRIYNCSAKNIYAIIYRYSWANV